MAFFCAITTSVAVSAADVALTSVHIHTTLAFGVTQTDSSVFSTDRFGTSQWITISRANSATSAPDTIFTRSSASWTSTSSTSDAPDIYVVERYIRSEFGSTAGTASASTVTISSFAFSSRHIHSSVATTGVQSFSTAALITGTTTSAAQTWSWSTQTTTTVRALSVTTTATATRAILSTTGTITQTTSTTENGTWTVTAYSTRLVANVGANLASRSVVYADWNEYLVSLTTGTGIGSITNCRGQSTATALTLGIPTWSDSVSHGTTAESVTITDTTLITLADADASTFGPIVTVTVRRAGSAYTTATTTRQSYQLTTDVGVGALAVRTTTTRTAFGLYSTVTSELLGVKTVTFTALSNGTGGALEEATGSGLSLDFANRLTFTRHLLMPAHPSSAQGGTSLAPSVVSFSDSRTISYAGAVTRVLASRLALGHSFTLSSHGVRAEHAIPFFGFRDKTAAAHTDVRFSDFTNSTSGTATASTISTYSQESSAVLVAAGGTLATAGAVNDEVLRRINRTLGTSGTRSHFLGGILPPTRPVYFGWIGSAEITFVDSTGTTSTTGIGESSNNAPLITSSTHGAAVVSIVPAMSVSSTAAASHTLASHHLSNWTIVPRNEYA